jgi:hypothetical protein
MSTFRLAHAEARQLAVDAVRAAPEGYVVKVEAPRRNLEQNALLHARLQEIANTRQWAGRSWPLEVWKRLVTGAWDRATGHQTMMLPALDGQGIEVIYRHTSKLDKKECSELIEWINAWDATT